MLLCQSCKIRRLLAKFLTNNGVCEDAILGSFLRELNLIPFMDERIHSLI